MPIIAFSGKKQSGKDTAGLITQTLLSFPLANNTTVKKYLNDPLDNPDWKIKKFAGYLKAITARLTGCSIADLEDEDKKNEVIYTKYRFINKYLGTDIEYEHADEGIDTYNHMVNVYLRDNPIDEVNQNITYKEVGITRRDILQRIGTDVARNIHSNIWIDELFSDYKEKKHYDTVLHKFDDAELIHHMKPAPTYQIPSNPAVPEKHHGKLISTKEYEFTENVINFRMPKWIITDTRFPNEVDAIKREGGLLIRINRNYNRDCTYCGKTIREQHKGCSEISCYRQFNPNLSTHISETALDNYNKFDYVIDNDGTIEDLINKIRVILIDNKLI